LHTAPTEYSHPKAVLAVAVSQVAVVVMVVVVVVEGHDESFDRRFSFTEEWIHVI
jgi:hypothetical protein